MDNVVLGVTIEEACRSVIPQECVGENLVTDMQYFHFCLYHTKSNYMDCLQGQLVNLVNVHAIMTVTSVSYVIHFHSWVAKLS